MDLLGWEENRTLRAALAALRDIGNSCGLNKSSGFVILTHLMEGDCRELLNEIQWDLYKPQTLKFSIFFEACCGL